MRNPDSRYASFVLPFDRNAEFRQESPSPKNAASTIDGRRYAESRPLLKIFGRDSRNTAGLSGRDNCT
jgi:hypothetical protein